ncbi:hypothetical protein F5X98DRAFT_386152, partial [Xylaria grammica]
ALPQRSPSSSYHHHTLTLTLTFSPSLTYYLGSPELEINLNEKMPHEVKNTATTVCGQPASGAAIDWCADCFLTTLKMTAKLGIGPDNLSVLDSLAPASNPYLGALLDALDLRAAVQHELDQQPGRQGQGHHNDTGNDNGNDHHLCLLVRAFVESVVRYAEAVKLYEVDNMGIRRWPGDIAHPECLTTNREVAAWLAERHLPPEMPPMQYWHLLRLPSSSQPQSQTQSQTLLQLLQKQSRRGRYRPRVVVIIIVIIVIIIIHTLPPPPPPALVLVRTHDPFLASHDPTMMTAAGGKAKANNNNNTDENIVMSSSSSSSPLPASSPPSLFRRLPSLVTPTRWLHTSDPPPTPATAPTPATPSSTRLGALVPSAPPNPNPTPNASPSSCSSSSTIPSPLSARTYRQSPLAYHPQDRSHLVPPAATSTYAPAASHPPPSSFSSPSPLPPIGAERKPQQTTTTREREREREPYFQSPQSPSADFSFVTFSEASERYFANPTPANRAEYDRLNDLLNGEVRRRMGDREKAITLRPRRGD